MRIGTRWMKCSAAVALMCVQLLAGAQIYTWTDEQGRKHFADEVGTPEHQRTTPVKVSPPNLVERFVPPAQSAQSADGDAAAQGAGSGATPTAPPAPSQGQRSPSRSSSREQACKAAKAAYEASLACFQGCGRRVVYGTDNSACGECQQLPMPDC